MGALIEEYGQFGSGVPTKSHPEGGYDNSFIIADPHEAYVVETAGHEWAIQRVERATGISNVYAIETDWSHLSPTAGATASERGWWSRVTRRCDRTRPV